MEELKRRILKDAKVDEGDIIRVDMFLNHCIDPVLMRDIGATLAQRFRTERITKVLTVESSGIAVACFTALALGVPAVYAKKFQTGYIDPDVYSAEVHSFSLEKAYTMRVARRYLDRDDRVLLVDDILASGQATLGLIEIVSKAGAEVAGVGVPIEKAMKDGGHVLRRMGIRVESLVTVERVENGTILLTDGL
ncbi:MAG: xanthine phosphoribosyltransferase [Intestinimonas sp.]|jgi:xanthine phosphoribosyltransferase|nr:xanthine phosphoribosyltransferase [Intestinimonas sp.]